MSNDFNIQTGWWIVLPWCAVPCTEHSLQWSPASAQRCYLGKKWNYNQRRYWIFCWIFYLIRFSCMCTGCKLCHIVASQLLFSGPSGKEHGLVQTVVCSLIFMAQFWLQPAHVFTYKLWALGHMCMHISQFSYLNPEQLLYVFWYVHRPWPRDRLHPGKLPRWTRTATRIAMATSLLVSIKTTQIRDVKLIFTEGHVSIVVALAGPVANVTLY